MGRRVKTTAENRLKYFAFSLTVRVRKRLHMFVKRVNTCTTELSQYKPIVERIQRHKILDYSMRFHVQTPLTPWDFYVRSEPPITSAH